MSYLFSSESVSEGHPDKVADQISDAILDQFLAYDDHARVACESFVTTGQVVLIPRPNTSSTATPVAFSPPSTSRATTSTAVSTMATKTSREPATRV